MNAIYENRSEKENVSCLFLDIVNSAMKITVIPRNGKEVLLEYAGQFDLLFDQFYQVMRTSDENLIYEYSRKRERYLVAALNQMRFLFAEMYSDLVQHSFFGQMPVLENMLVSIEAQIRILENVAAVYIDDNRYQDKIRHRLLKGQLSLDVIYEDLEDGWALGGQAPTAKVSTPSHESIVVDWHTMQSALTQLTDKQRRRFIDHYIVGMSVKEIADAEGVKQQSVRESIDKAVAQLVNIL